MLCVYTGLYVLFQNNSRIKYTVFSDNLLMQSDSSIKFLNINNTSAQLTLNIEVIS